LNNKYDLTYRVYYTIYKKLIILMVINYTIKNLNKVDNVNNSNIIQDQNEKNHNEILLQLEEIKKLSIKIENLFVNNKQNNFLTLIEFNYDFKKEYAGGFIEYKRTLSSYGISKIDKLIRQIYWRIYEGLVTENVNLCYYIIGLEDSGIPSKITQEELEISINVISDAMKNVDLKFTYLYLYNSLLDYNFVIVKFLLDEKNNSEIEYF
jgi:hypothetical protein